MGRASTKPNKNLFQLSREELELTREKASEVLQSITPDRIEKIENEKAVPYPDEILVMANGYKKPELCNYYCSHICEIGRKYVPEVKIKDLSRIVLEIIASMNRMGAKNDRLIEIAADGGIANEVYEDFEEIRKELGNISMAIEELRLWAEKMKAAGIIDKDEF